MSAQRTPDDEARELAASCQGVAAMFAKHAMFFELGASYRIRQQRNAAEQSAHARWLLRIEVPAIAKATGASS